MKAQEIKKEREAGKLIAIVATAMILTIITVGYWVSKFGVAHLM